MPSGKTNSTPMTAAARTRDVRPYRPAKPLGPIDLWLDANEGPAATSRLRDALASIDAEALRRYPDPSAIERVLGEARGIDPDRVLLTAGGDDAINRLCLAVLEPGRTLLQHTPTFSMIEHSARLAGASIRSVAWSRGAFPLEAFLDEIRPGIRMVSVVSPNNPTGGALALDQILKIVDRAAGIGAVVMVDLAYAEFADEDPTERLLAFDNVVVIRTFSKAWAMAGLRLGYMIGAPQVVEWCRATGGPYAVSGVSLAVLGELLGRGATPDGPRIELVRAERARLMGVLGEIGIEAMESQANFVLADFGSGARATWVRDALAGLGISVRAFSSPELATSIRITCPGDEASFARLEAALRSACAPEAILFDLDGVLADVSASYREAIRRTVESFGGRITPGLIAAAKLEGDANNDWVLSQRLLARQGIEATLEDVTARFERFYQGEGATLGLWQTESLLTTRSVLDRIRRRAPIAIVTGRPRRDAERFLAHAGIDDLFAAIVCMEDGPAKPAPDVVCLAMQRLGARRAWMVGDTVDDIRAARAAGVVPIGIVPPGDAPGESSAGLLRAGASRVLARIDEIMELPS